MDDEVIVTKTKMALAEDPLSGLRDVNVEVVAGVVNLSGEVDTEMDKAAAGRVAVRVDGVLAVENRITVRKLDPPAVRQIEKTDDAKAAAK